jgi:hypothetical protein
MIAELTHVITYIVFVGATLYALDLIIWYVTAFERLRPWARSILSLIGGVVAVLLLSELFFGVPRMPRLI